MNAASSNARRALVSGATGFIGRALVPALLARGFEVKALSRKATPPSAEPRLSWQRCDLLDLNSLQGAFAGVHVAYYLVHSMGNGSSEYRELEARSARTFVEAAERARVERIVYLGGPSPPGLPSEHLQSRLQVGEILRGSRIPTVELRASMVVGAGSASWRIVRDLALRLPIMVLPRWLGSRTRPVALSDVIFALVAAADVHLSESEWFDIPGPEILNGQQILERIAALRGRRFLALRVPFLTPQLSALWLRLITRTEFSLARELVLGLKQDLLPKDDRYWQLIGHSTLMPFDEAARHALASE